MERRKVELPPEPPPPPPKVERRRVELPPEQPDPDDLLGPPTGFLNTGSTMLNLVLGGGWAKHRVFNVVGDKSSGKTLLAIEACAIHAQEHGADSIRYVEAESAFDARYAESIGMPRGLRTTDDIQTVEQWEDDLVAFLESRQKGDEDSLYIVDSLDALSDTAEMARDNEKGSYGAAKAKKISEMFRKRIKLIAERRCTLGIISQIRDVLNSTGFGETKKRSGGKALDFYASQVVWLAHTKQLKRTTLGIERVVGSKVEVQTKKNKVGPPFRKAEMDVIFSYGVDDEISMLNWLVSNKATNLLPITPEEMKAAIASCRKARERDALADLTLELREAVTKHWMRVEEALRPPMSKYGN